MFKTIDILVTVFTLTTFILISGSSSTLAPQRVRHAFTDIITINTLPLFGGNGNVSVTMKGECFLGETRESCVDIMSIVFKGHFTGYETQEELEGVREMSLKMAEFQTWLFASHQLFHGLLLVACYALLCFAWEDKGAPSSNVGTTEPTSLRPLKKFAVVTLGLSTVAGVIATATGVAISISLSKMLKGSLASPDDIRIGSGWIITLAATFGCLIATEVAVEALLRPEVEGRIALPEDEESYQPEMKGEKSTFVPPPGRLPITLA